MKNILTIALMLFWMSSFAQIEILDINSTLHFGSTNGGFIIDFKNDSMIVKSNIPMNEAGMLLAKFAMKYYTHYTDSLKSEIKRLKYKINWDSINKEIPRELNKVKWHEN